jgi:hypothetical protein
MANPISIFLDNYGCLSNKQHKAPLTVNEKEIITKRAEVANQGIIEHTDSKFTCDSLKWTF